MLYRRFYGHVGPDVFLLFYLTYVRPHLEYAAVVWDPHQQGLITALENVQKFALRACTRNWKSDYNTLLERCKVPTLAQRRQFMKLCFMYQVVNQLVVFPPEFIERRTLSRSLRNSSVFNLQRPIIMSYQCTPVFIFSSYRNTLEQFAIRSAKLWLPNHIQEQSIHLTLQCHNNFNKTIANFHLYIWVHYYVNKWLFMYPYNKQNYYTKKIR